MSDSCGCCTGIAQETPATVQNRAGLSAVAYRAGTHSQFLSTMLAQLGTVTTHGLRTRRSDDFSIALLDSTAIVCDVLTFYNERIANENYLRTATELLSIGELGRLIGYSLRPGCSANSFLAFRLNDPPVNADKRAPDAAQAPLMNLSSALGVMVPKGTKVQSVPGPNQTPQTFETSVDLNARWVANALQPRLTRPYPTGATGIGTIYLQDSAIPPAVGDRLLLMDDANSTRLATVMSVDRASYPGVVVVGLDGTQQPAPGPPPVPATTPPSDDLFDDALVGEIVDGQIWDRNDLATLIARRNWSIDAFEATVNAQRQANPAGTALSCYTVRSGVSLFGHNAPAWASLPPILIYAYQDQATNKPITPAWVDDWDTDNTVGTYTLSSYYIDTTIDLDNVYPSIVPGVWLALTMPGTSITGQVQAVRTVSRAAYGMTARVTNVALMNVQGGDLSTLNPRTTEIFVQGSALPLAPLQITDNVGGTSILLARCCLQLLAGGYVAITGERIDRAGRTSVEIAQIAQATLEDGYTRLTFTQQLDGTYLIGTLYLNANVVTADNGETVSEALGQGSAGTPSQSFALRQVSDQLPLTWTSAAVPGGADAAIKVFVNGVRWKRVPYLYGSAPTDRVFTLVRDINDKTLVQFGDGTTFGARPPSGTENIMAQYRRGIGSAGLVTAGQLTMLVTRPPGVRDVTNPLDANGAADPETVAQSRINAPFAVRTLDRIVTLDDYADFVRASAGIAKARVDLTWRGAQRVILLTVAGPRGAQIVDPSPLHDDLVTALSNAAEAAFPVALKTFRSRLFTVSAGLLIDQSYQQDQVCDAVRTALWTAFSFDSREFGQPAFPSEVIAVIQNTPGVVASNLAAFCFSDAAILTVEDRLDAEPAAVSGAGAVGAELLTIDSIPATLTVLA
jgi:predicted phage baseplate assembly protein